MGQDRHDSIPRGVFSLLLMNRAKNKGEILRAKILKYHFNDGAAVGPAFAGVQMTSIPSVIGWIGRDCVGFSAMYHLLRSMPWLVELNTKPVARGPVTLLEPPAKFRKFE